MSTEVGQIHYNLDLDKSKFDKSASSINDKLKNLGNSMTNLGKKMTIGLTLPIVTGAGLSVKAASDLNETINKVEVAFGDSAQAVKDWSKTTIDNIGLAGSSAMEAASLFGDMGTSMGLSRSEAATMSMSLTNLAGDLASFKNLSIDQAMTALAGVFTGETESLKRLGIVMTQTQLEQFRLNQGIKKGLDEMSQAEIVSLRYAYVMSVTKNAQGDFARTFDGTANQIRVTRERLKELSENIGKQLLPYVNKALGFLQTLIKRFQDLSPEGQKIALVVAGIAAAIGPLLIVLGTLITSMAALGGVGTAIVLGIGVLVGALAYLQIKFGFVTKSVDFLREKAQQLWSWIDANLMPTLRLIADVVLHNLIVAWDNLKQAFQNVMTVMEPYKPYLDDLAKIIGMVLVVAVGVFVGAIVGAIVILGTIIEYFAKLINWISKAVVWWQRISGEILHFVTKIPGMIMDYFSNPGEWLYEAGRKLIQGLVNGIKSMANAPVEAAKKMLNEVRNLFPFSPAKEGPFSGQGWTQYSGQSLIKGLADGIKSFADMPRTAMNDVMTGIKNVNNNSSTSIYGNINIANQQDADYFMKRLNREQFTSEFGLSDLGSAYV